MPSHLLPPLPSTRPLVYETATRTEASPQSCLLPVPFTAPLPPASCRGYCHPSCLLHPDPWLAPRRSFIPRVPPIAPCPCRVHESSILPRTNFASTSSAPQTACNHATSVTTGRTQPSLTGDAVATLALHHASSSASMPAAPASVEASAWQSVHLLLLRRWWQMLDPPHSLHLFLHRRCWQMLDPPHSLHLLLRRRYFY